MLALSIPQDCEDHQKQGKWGITTTNRSPGRYDGKSNVVPVSDGILKWKLQRYESNMGLAV